MIYLLFNILLLIIGVPAFSYEACYSELSFIIKRMLGIKSAYLVALSSWKVLAKSFGKFIAFIMLPLLIMANMIRLLDKITSCHYCTSFWLSLTLAFMLKLPILMCFAIAGTSLFVAGLYNLIRKYSA
jgi:hypothetical protein